MAKRLVSASKLTAIGDAIRAKTGSSGLLTLDQMAASIDESFVYEPALMYIDALKAAASSRSLDALSWADLFIVAQSLELNGNESKAYNAAVACAKAGAYKTFDYGGSTVYATLVDVLHSYRPDGSSMLGLDFMCSAGAPSSTALVGTSNGLTTMAMNSSNTNRGGWGSSTSRTTLNSTVYNNFPSDMRVVMQKRHVPYGPTQNSTSASVDYTDDYLWLMSYSEVFGKNVAAWLVSQGWLDKTNYAWMNNEGEQLTWFKNAGIAANGSTSNFSALIGGSDVRWLRSCYPNTNNVFGLFTHNTGSPGNGYAKDSYFVFPCFSL